MQYEELVALLPDYLDNKLSQRERQWVTEALKTSDELRRALSSLEDLHQARAGWQDEEVPHWHRTAFAARNRNTSGNWMNWLSLATSMAAILLVVFRIQVVSNTDGYQVSFGDSTDKVTFKRQADAYLDDWQAEQIAYIDHRLLEFENLQLQQNQQFITTALDVNRMERRQDISQLTRYLVKQQANNRLLTASQYQKLYNSQSENHQAIETLYASLEK
jgi:hypothetical protein